MAKRPKWEWDPLDNDLLRALVQEEREPPLVLAEVFACSVRQIRAVCRRLGIEYFTPAVPAAETEAPQAPVAEPEVDRPDEADDVEAPEVIPVEETRLELSQLVREVRVILEASGPLQLTALMRQLQVAGVFNSEKEVLLAIAKDRGIREQGPRKFRLVS